MTLDTAQAPHDMAIWLATAATVGLVLLYEAIQHWHHSDAPVQLARSAHADLREAWFRAISEQSSSEIVAVQTLRNAVMSATLMASTATLGLMGTVTLAASQWHASPDVSGGLPWPALTPRLLMELCLMATLFTALACSLMAVRYFNHVSFISAMPVHSPQRQSWLEMGVSHIRKAGVLYSWSLRALLMVAPLVAAIVHPMAGPVAAMGLVVVLWRMDRVQTDRVQAGIKKSRLMP